jgi:16S rRNA (guanine966-N2)-methyltransferase
MRPTMDRVRGAIFSSLGDAVPGARILDLFAGSGAMGIEALSRGAGSAVFVDSHPVCTACVKANLRTIGFEGSVQTMEALKFLELYAEDGFDLIFADPPYATDRDGPDPALDILAAPALAAALRSTGTLVLERRARGANPLVSAFSLLRSRRYGKSAVDFYTLP